MMNMGATFESFIARPATVVLIVLDGVMARWTAPVEMMRKRVVLPRASAMSLDAQAVSQNCMCPFCRDSFKAPVVQIS